MPAASADNVQTREALDYMAGQMQEMREKMEKLYADHGNIELKYDVQTQGPLPRRRTETSG